MTDLQKRKIEQMRQQGYGYGKIAKAIGISENTVKSYCRRIKRIQSNNEIAHCEQCGTKIDKKMRSSRRFCSDHCRMRWWNAHPNHEPLYHANCAYCGKEIQMRRKNERKYCSHQCYIKARFGQEAPND